MAKKRSNTNRPRNTTPKLADAHRPNTPGAADKTVKAKQPSGSDRRAAALNARNRNRRTRIGAVVGAGVLVMVGVISLAVFQGGATAGSNTTTAAWDLPRLGQSGSVSLASLRGKPVVLNMFASWCTTCRGELPAFASAARQLKGQVTFVEVNSLETGSGQGMAQQFGLSQAGAVVLADVGGAQKSGLHDALGGGNNMPVSAFYSSTGQLLTSHVGGFTFATLKSQLHQLYGINIH
jgi:thiol-disulfide isomerase/thioredoxin